MDERLNILNENLNSKEGETNNSLQLINDLEGKYQQEIEEKHKLIKSLEIQINQLKDSQ